MPIKVTKHDPPPEVIPPTTYSIDGLLQAELKLVGKAIQHGVKAGTLSLSLNERDRLDRLLRVIEAQK